jgi:hypothetical protein
LDEHHYAMLTDNLQRRVRDARISGIIDVSAAARIVDHLDAPHVLAILYPT